jgi:hypothetical protein
LSADPSYSLGDGVGVPTSQEQHSADRAGPQCGFEPLELTIAAVATSSIKDDSFISVLFSALSRIAAEDGGSQPISFVV